MILKTRGCAEEETVVRSNLRPLGFAFTSVDEWRRSLIP